LLIDLLTSLCADFRETAPAAAFEDMFQGNVMGSVTGGLASGVPGDIAGLEYVHNKYGVSHPELSGWILLMVFKGLALASSVQSCDPCCEIWLSGYVFTWFVKGEERMEILTP
jgi:hypothetical protein